MQINDIKAEDLKIPRHVAIIMDGNGRWAKGRGMPRVFGHQRGAQAVRRIVEASASLGVNMLTLFAFSSENWKRPKLEVSALMQLFARALDKEAPLLQKNSIKLRVIGDLSAFSESLQNKIMEAQEMTADGERMTLNIAANYGGRWDILQAARKLVNKAQNDGFDINSIDEKLFSQELSITQDVDLMIRTGGEKRISNFLMWQVSYGELFFSDTLWPDFDRDDLISAFEFYSGRERRFGMISEQLRDVSK